MLSAGHERRCACIVQAGGPDPVRYSCSFNIFSIPIPRFLASRTTHAARSARVHAFHGPRGAAKRSRL